jgi:hypothetical protein
MCPFVDLPDPPQPMSKSDMVMLERALRNGWPTPAETLRAQLERVQAVLDNSGSHPRARRQAERIMALAAGQPASRPAPQHRHRQRRPRRL